MLENNIPEIAGMSRDDSWMMIQAIIIIVVAFLIYRLFNRLFNKVAERGFIHEQLRLTSTFTIRWLIIIISIISLMGTFGVSVESIWAAFSAIIVMFAIGFVAVWSVLSNMFCSVLLVIFAPFRIGDEIELQDAAADIRVSGKVTGINLMHTTLVSLNDGEEEVIRVPNNFFFHKYIRRLPGKRTKSIKTYMAEQHEHALAEQEQAEHKKH
ncbi:MAG: mechanosensitive ion channel family protein [Gammaproteobacteria bacterium]|nr:mechanosensitive ion channel family protein [Gammaproteobacteria bacterium]MDH5777785.1 mechanosensitive ion channel family protein [Gammaproteobacteria bacterium]